MVIENVPGLLREQTESGLDRFYRMLVKNKYAIAADILNAKNYGVPQSRKRFVLIASRVNKSISLPQPEKESIRREFIGAHNGFPVLKSGHKDDNKFMDTVASLAEKNMRRLKLTPKNGGTRKAWKDNPELQLDAYKGKDRFFSRCLRKVEMG